MQSSSPWSWPRRLLALAAFVAVTCVLVALAQRNIPPENVCPDFLNFWVGAALLRAGQNPYDVALQTVMNHDLGWTKAGDGLGIYEFLPFYYPPWMAIAVQPLLALGYPLARLTWLVLEAEFVVLAALLLKDRVRGLFPGLVIAVVVLFGFSIKVVAIGQSAPIVLLLVAVAWTLLEQRRDMAAGVALSFLTIKPQLTLLLIGGVLVWTLLRRRWAVSLAFLGSLSVLCLASTVSYHGWFNAMLGATRVTPMPTAYFPGLGATWYTVLGALGAKGTLLYAAYAAVALPVLWKLMRMTLDRDTALEDLFAAALLAPFFVAPYARAYDFPVLLVSALVLMGTRLPPLLRATMAFALVVLANQHIIWVTMHLEPVVVGVRRPEFTYFWIPLMVAFGWLYYGGNGSRQKGNPSPTTGPLLPPDEQR